MARSMSLKHDKYQKDLSRINIFLYVAMLLTYNTKINGMMYGLESTNEKT